MKIKSTRAAALLMFLAAAGCTVNQPQKTDREREYKVYEVAVAAESAGNDTRASVYLEGADICIEQGDWKDNHTRSRLCIEDNLVKDINCYAFTEDGQLAVYGKSAGEELEGKPCALYISDFDGGSFRWELPVGVKLDICIAANMGKELAPPSTIDGLSDDNWICHIDDIDDLNESGIPMGGRLTFTDDSGNATITVPLKRIVARYVVRVIDGSSDTRSFSITDIQLTNVNRSVSLFKEGDYIQNPYSGANAEGIADDELETINSSGEAVFYATENCATTGHSIVTGAAAWTEVFQQLNDIGYEGYPTLLNFSITRVMNDGQTVTQPYHLYLGKDCVTNLDIVRNNSYNITLKLRDMDDGGDGQTAALIINGPKDVIPVGTTRSITFSAIDFRTTPKISFSTDNNNCTLTQEGSTLHISLNRNIDIGSSVTVFGRATDGEDEATASFSFSVGDAIPIGASNYRIALASPMPITNSEEFSLSRSLDIEYSDGYVERIDNYEIEEFFGQYSNISYSDETFEATGNYPSDYRKDNKGNIIMLASEDNCTVNDDCTDNEIYCYIRKGAKDWLTSDLKSNSIYPDIYPTFEIEFEPFKGEDYADLWETFSCCSVPQDGDAMEIMVTATIYSTSAAEEIESIEDEGIDVHIIENEGYDSSLKCWKYTPDENGVVQFTTVETTIYPSEKDESYTIEYLSDTYRTRLTDAIVARYEDEGGRRRYVRVNPDYMRIELTVNSGSTHFYSFIVNGGEMSLDSNGILEETLSYWIFRY